MPVGGRPLVPRRREPLSHCGHDGHVHRQQLLPGGRPLVLVPGSRARLRVRATGEHAQVDELLEPLGDGGLGDAGVLAASALGVIGSLAVGPVIVWLGWPGILWINVAAIAAVFPFAWRVAGAARSQRNASRSRAACLLRRPQPQGIQRRGSLRVGYRLRVHEHCHHPGRGERGRVHRPRVPKPITGAHRRGLGVRPWSSPAGTRRLVPAASGACRG